MALLPTLSARESRLSGDSNAVVTPWRVRDGFGLRLHALIAHCGALNLGRLVERIPNADRIGELAIDKQSQTILMPAAARRQFDDLPDDLWTKISIEFYKDSTDAVFKALVE